MSIQAQKGEFMKGHLKLYKGLAIFALAAGVCLLVTMSYVPIASSADPSPQGQSTIRRASPTPPPEVAALQKILKEHENIPKSQARATKQQLEGLIMKQDGGADRIRMARAKTVPSQARKPNAAPPPEVVERDRLEKQQQNIPKAQSRATRQQLEALIMRHEGGADKLKRAKEGKPPTSQNWQGLRNVMAWLNPFNIQTAYAQTQALSRDYKLTRPATMCGNNPNFFDLIFCSAPYGNVMIPGYQLNYSTPNLTQAFVTAFPSYIVADGKNQYSYVQLNQTFATNGYYIVNLNALVNAGTSIKLWHYSPTGWVNIKTFTNSGNGTVNLPHLDYFTAGNHYFAWTISYGNFFMYQVNVDSY